MSIQQKRTAILINQPKLSNCNITKNKKFLKLQKMAKSCITKLQIFMLYIYIYIYIYIYMYMYSMCICVYAIAADTKILTFVSNRFPKFRRKC